MQMELFNKKYDINVYRLLKHLDEEVAARPHLKRSVKLTKLNLPNKPLILRIGGRTL